MGADVAIEQVKAAEAERRRALVAGDVSALERLFADDLVHAHASGVVHDKRQIIDYVTTVLTLKDVRRGELNVRVFGDIAVMTGDMTNVAQRAGTDETISLDLFATQVWRRESEGWRVISFHAVRKPAAES